MSEYEQMTLEQARAIVAEATEMRLRWGKMFSAKDIGEARLLDALVVFAKHEGKHDVELKEQLTKANRQLGAALAREKKYRKKLGLDTTDTTLENDHDE
jgi:hypothetical protein